MDTKTITYPKVNESVVLPVQLRNTHWCVERYSGMVVHGNSHIRGVAFQIVLVK